jgi:hypothetical protein
MGNGAVENGPGGDQGFPIGDRCRFESIYMGHWSFSEMSAAFNWNSDQFVWFGGYPGAAPIINEEDRWKSYIHTAGLLGGIEKYSGNLLHKVAAVFPGRSS